MKNKTLYVVYVGPSARYYTKDYLSLLRFINEIGDVRYIRVLKMENGNSYLGQYIRLKNGRLGVRFK